MLKILDIQRPEGNPSPPLDGPDKILLSASTARKYFGNDDPLGKHLRGLERGATENYQVAGVFRDYPANSHLIINHLVSYSTLGKIIRNYGDSTNATETSWGWYDYYAYLQLRPGADWHALQAKLPAFS